jgi:hypothetical protein
VLEVVGAAADEVGAEADIGLSGLVQTGGLAVCSADPAGNAGDGLGDAAVVVGGVGGLAATEDNDGPVGADEGARQVMVT